MLLEREGVLERLRELGADARRGRGRLVLVSGEAGIGKTAAMSAFVDGLGRETVAYWGSSDAVSPPRPFAAVADIAERTGGALRHALIAADRDRVFDAFLTLIRHGPGRSRVVVLEDLHWADEATADLLRVCGPRLRNSPVLVVGTYRDHEVGPRHPLRLAIGDLPADVVARVSVPPLSPEAVARLAQDTLLDARALHQITAGNAFFVTEVIAGYGSEIPSSVHDAVLARVDRLSRPAQELIRACAVLGPRCESDVALVLAGCPRAALDECIARGVLEHDDDTLSFRHEVARRSIIDTIDGPERSRLNAAALALLRHRADKDPARLARHAAEAGDADAILEFAVRAGARAASLGAHREAAEHYASALELADALDGRDRAQLLQAHAHESALLDDIPAARESQRRALVIWEELQDVAGQAACLRGVSWIEYLAGDTENALAAARKAVSLLEPIRPVGPEHGRAYAVLAQRLMVSGRDDAGAVYATKAQLIAKSFDDEATAVHALTSLGCINIYAGDEDGWRQLEESHARARAADLSDEVSRALINLTEAGLDMWRLDVADRYGPLSTAWFEEHDLDLYGRLIGSRMAELALRRGRWSDAARIANDLLQRETTANVVRVRALALLGLLAVRRGDTDPWPLLDRALSVLQPTEGSQELLLVRTCRTEAALSDGDGRRARTEATEVMSILGYTGSDPAASEGLFWAWRAGVIPDLLDFVVAPFRLHAQGRFADAADAWRELGCPYYEALARADIRDANQLLRALDILHRLGAKPAARLVTERLRELGAEHLPRGPRTPTRANPFGLTVRELEVLVMLGESMRNSQIAARLVLSPKTVDRHVTSILRKLGVHDRSAAGAQARSMGLKDGVPPVQDGESPVAPRT